MCLPFEILGIDNLDGYTSRRSLKRLSLCAALLFSVQFVSAEPVYLSQYSWAAVLDPGNPPDSATGYGRVDSEFEIGKTEITNAQYAQFLNSVASQADPLELWHSSQINGPMGGIHRVPKAGGYEYKVVEGYADLPVVHISWFNAARFCNWLHYGQPVVTASGLGSATEGDSERGAYDTSNFPPYKKWPGSASRMPMKRNPHARYWLPSLNEWIKAGFYRPQSNGQYSLYATGSDNVPKAEPPPGGANSANYYLRGWAIPYPHLTPVGAYRQSTSSYGTYDQAGNVMEWLEDRLPQSPRKRRFAGGAAARMASMLRKDYEDWEDADHRMMIVGFRAARVRGATQSLRRVAVHLIPASLPSETASQTHKEHKSGLDFITIGDPGNPADPKHGYGAVNTIFDIGKYELTHTDYANFLNAVAKQDDPYALYETSMSDGLLGGLIRELTKDGYRFSTKPGWENRPIGYLNWYRLARLANWLHFGKPAAGVGGPGVTEGDHLNGAYDTRGFPKPDSDDVVPKDLPSTRNPGALYWIPSQDEWFKAAHYDPTRKGSRSYWDYPTRSDSPPNNRPPPGDFDSANYVADLYCIGMPWVVTEVGSFPNARSYYGTFDQAGNLWEWTESWRQPRSKSAWRANEFTRVLRGGSATYSYIGLNAANADPGHPNHALCVYGGRMARRTQK